MKKYRDALRVCAGVLFGFTVGGSIQSAHAQFAIPAPPTTPLPLVQFGQDLKNDGIYFSGIWVNQVAAVSGGGLKHDAIAAGEALLGTVFDLETIAGIPGASIHINLDWRYGDTINQYVGALYSLNADVGPQRSLRLSNLFWEQTFLDNRLNVTLGRTQQGFDFDVNSFGCEFLNGSTCSQAIPTLFSTSINAYPSSVWGTRINYNVTDAIYVRTGAYQEDPTQLEAGQHGLTHWGIEHSVGVTVPIEVGYQTSPFAVRYPQKFLVGGFIDTSSHSPILGDNDGKNGNTAVYGHAEQTVWRPYPNSPQFLALFGGFWAGTGGVQPFKDSIYAGFFTRGPFQLRPYDTVGFQANYIALAHAGPVRSPHAQEWVFELNYGINVASGVTLKPYVQYVLHPDMIGFPPTRKVNDATVVGLLLSVNMNAALGLPFFLPHS